MSELWKDVYGYENSYEVSSEGRVRSKQRLVRKNENCSYWVNGKILKPQKRRHGYLSVWLCSGTSKQQASVHRLVAEAFCKREDGQDEVNHLNENKQDNRASNLAWCTKQENCSYGSRGATISRKNTNGKRSKHVKQYTLSGEFVAEYPSIHEAYRQTGIHVGCIHSVMKGYSKQTHGYVWSYA